MKRIAMPALLLLASLVAFSACDKEAKPDAPKGVTTPVKKADDKKADAKKADDKKMGGAKDAKKMDAKKADPKKMDAKKVDPTKGTPAPAGATGDLKPGQNSPKFLEGIDGTGSKLLALIETDKGSLECTLHEKQTPQTVMNFVGLARGLKAFKDPKTKQSTKRPFYDGIAFHRVIPKFMVQVGDPNGIGNYNPGYKFANEIVPDLKHTSGGLLSMANAGPGTNGSQIFITEVATPWLDGKHTVFGKCTKESIKVVETMARVPTGPGNKPLQPVTIRKISFKRAN